MLSAGFAESMTFSPASVSASACASAPADQRKSKGLKSSTSMIRSLGSLTWKA